MVVIFVPETNLPLNMYGSDSKKLHPTLPIMQLISVFFLHLNQGTVPTFVRF